MVDFEQIGRRILEERKYLHKISQEKMAEDLGMYQADISNLEKAKNGSGITDLAKLDMIADYFDMPLEALLFGRRQDQMEKYYGSKMQLKESAKKISVKHESILRKLLGYSKEDGEISKNALTVYECGPYTVYVVLEVQTLICGPAKTGNDLMDSIVKPHIYVVYQDEVIGCLTAYATTVMQHVYRPAFEQLKNFIFPDIFDLDDTWDVLNPYSLLYRLPLTEEEQAENEKKMVQRMDSLRESGEGRLIYYVENAYVREDCRRNGILRMMIDVLKAAAIPPMIWISLEPTAGAELDSEYSYHSTYQASELGQISMNASIAERLGFMIDPKTVDLQAERVEEDGSVVVDTVPVRRAAYYLPKKIRNILARDGDTLAYARAREKSLEGESEKPDIVDIYQSAWKKLGFVMAIKLVYSNETVFAFARGMDWKSHWLGVSYSNPGPEGEFVETFEKYDSLKEAENSKYYIALKVAEQLLGATFFGTVKPENVQLDLLQ